ncbi:MAG: four helix bundle protein [Bacteroidota bacterium]
MATFRSFEEIHAWQKARVLARDVYSVTRAGCFGRDQGLVSQMRRASVSVMSNIAEGCERRSRREFARFIDIARGSAGEVRAQLYVALDAGYVDEVTFKQLSMQATEISRMLYGLGQHLRSTA